MLVLWFTPIFRILFAVNSWLHTFIYIFNLLCLWGYDWFTTHVFLIDTLWWCRCVSVSSRSLSLSLVRCCPLFPRLLIVCSMSFLFVIAVDLCYDLLIPSDYLCLDNVCSPLSISLSSFSSFLCVYVGIVLFAVVHIWYCSSHALYRFSTLPSFLPSLCMSDNSYSVRSFLPASLSLCVFVCVCVYVCRYMCINASLTAPALNLYQDILLNYPAIFLISMTLLSRGFQLAHVYVIRIAHICCDWEYIFLVVLFYLPCVDVLRMFYQILVRRICYI